MYEIFLKLLNEHNITAYKVGKATGIGASTFSDWKNGRSEPKREKLQKIADYFGVSIEYLMTGKELSEKEPQLPPQNDKEIMDIVANTKRLLKQDELTLDGKPASPEVIDSILSGMQIGLELARKKNR